jgi:hypothetical protein
MRNLNLDEISDKVREYSNDLEYIDRKFLNSKLTHFWTFLNQQPITKRIFDRFEEDYKEFHIKIFEYKPFEFQKHTSKIRKLLIASDIQGAFAYFILKENFKIEKRYPDMELELTSKWFETSSQYDEIRIEFNIYIFKPFIELLNWYLYESKSINPNDYFSKAEVNEFSKKLDDLLIDIRLGQEVIFEEIQDLKENLKNLKKKNWGELLKGKLFDMAIGKLISIETFTLIIKTITGEELKFLN